MKNMAYLIFLTALISTSARAAQNQASARQADINRLRDSLPVAAGGKGIGIQEQQENKRREENSAGPGPGLIISRFGKEGNALADLGHNFKHELSAKVSDIPAIPVEISSDTATRLIGVVGASGAVLHALNSGPGFVNGSIFAASMKHVIDPAGTMRFYSACGTPILICSNFCYNTYEGCIKPRISNIPNYLPNCRTLANALTCCTPSCLKRKKR